MHKHMPNMLLCVLEHWFSIGSISVNWSTYMSFFFNVNCGV